MPIRTFGLVSLEEPKPFTFQGKSWSPDEIINALICWAKHFSLTNRRNTTVDRDFDRGELLAGEWLYLNTNRAVRLESESTIVGGVLRNKSGEWVLGYYKHLGKCFILYAKLWAIFEGLKIIQLRGHAKVVI